VHDQCVKAYMYSGIFTYTDLPKMGGASTVLMTFVKAELINLNHENQEDYGIRSNMRNSSLKAEPVSTYYLAIIMLSRGSTPKLFVDHRRQTIQCWYLADQESVDECAIYRLLYRHLEFFRDIIITFEQITAARDMIR